MQPTPSFDPSPRPGTARRSQPLQVAPDLPEGCLWGDAPAPPLPPNLYCFDEA
jgi:hypothetical protein